jgi:hypothetical protein
MADDTRIAVLEQIAQSHDRRITAMEDFQKDVVDRLDQKIQLDATSQIQLEKTLVKAVTTLEIMVDSVREMSTIARSADTLVKRHDTLLSMSLRIASGLGVIIPIAWAVYVYMVK